MLLFGAFNGNYGQTEPLFFLTLSINYLTYLRTFPTQWFKITQVCSVESEDLVNENRRPQNTKTKSPKHENDVSDFLEISAFLATHLFLAERRDSRNYSSTDQFINIKASF